MEKNFPRQWMWSDAFEMLARAERMHRQFLQPPSSPSSVTWEPPVDVLETERAVLVLVALPGVDLDEVKALIDGDTLMVSGNSNLSAGDADRDHTPPGASAGPVRAAGSSPARTLRCDSPNRFQRLPLDHAAEVGGP